MRKIAYKTNQNHPQIKAYKQALTKGSNSQHVLPKGDAWIVKRAGSQRATRTFETQVDAMKFAKNIAKNKGASLFVHGRDGRIRDRKDFGS